MSNNFITLTNLMERAKKEAIREKVHSLNWERGIPKIGCLASVFVQLRSKEHGTRVIETLAMGAFSKRKERGWERRKHKEANHKKK